MAVTCGEDGFLDETECTIGLECVEYVVHELLWDGSWSAGRDVVWAGCGPSSAASCSFSFNGTAILPSEPPHCEGQAKAHCQMYPVPAAPPTVAYYTELGLVAVEPCAALEICAMGCDELPTCIAADTATCSGDLVSCNGSEVTKCCNGYQHVQDTCSANEICAPVMQPASQGLLACNYVTSAECASPLDVCDPQNDDDYCSGNVARRCRGIWQEHDCASSGLSCVVSANGVAGCVNPGLPSCLANVAYCDGNTHVDCCGGCGFALYSAACAPGYATYHDCTQFGQSCADGFGPAECM